MRFEAEADRFKTELTKERLIVVKIKSQNLNKN